MKITSFKPLVLSVCAAVLGTAQLAGAASATWLAAPFNNNWLAAPTTNNWSTGVGTFPGNTAGSGTTDIASFTNRSTITTVNCASGFAIGGITFDSSNCSPYTINTSGGTWRLNTGNAAIRITSAVTNKQTITGSLRMATGGTLNVINDSTTPSATLNITTGIAVNNSTSSGNTLILGGTNTGPNILGTYTENTASAAVGNLIKTNSGFWALTGNSTYHSNTFVLGGTLMLMNAGAIPNSLNITVSGATLNVSNTMSNPNSMFVTNSASLILTNTGVTASPLTIGTLTVSNATLHLGVNGASPYTDISASSLTTGPGVVLAIDRVTAVTSATTFTLIGYSGTDPDPASFSVSLGASYLALGYTISGASVGGGAVSVTITPPLLTPLVWVGATNSVPVSNWDTNKTKNWLDVATLSVPQAFLNLDTVTFDDTASTGTVTLITTNLPNGITVNNNTLNYLFNGGGKISGPTGLTKQGNAALTLAESGGSDFSGGIAVNTGLLVLDETNSAISGGLTVSGGAAAQVGNNDSGGALPAGAIDDEGSLVFSRANSLSVSASIFGGGTLTQNGNGKLTLTASNSYTGITVASKGTLALSGAGLIMSSPGLLVSNATLDVSGIAGTATLNDLSITNASLNVGTTSLSPALAVSTFEVDGITAKSNVINVLALPGIASYPVTLTLVKSASPITLTAGNFNFALGSLPAGSPAYAGHLSESADNTAILITLTAGPTGVRPPIIWTGVDNVTATTNWSDGSNWQLPGTPTSADSLIFDSATTVAAATTINSFVSSSLTVAGLSYLNTNSQYQVTQIPAGVTLTVSSNFTVGGFVVDNDVTHAVFVDAGTLVVNAANANLVGSSGVTGTSGTASLDLSGLSNFVYNASSATLGVGNVGGRGTGTLNLAAISNNITAGSIAIMTSSASSSVSATTTLGAGTNIINASTINIAATRSSGTLKFPTGSTAAGLRLRGTGGTDADRSTIVLGNRSSGGSSGTATGTLALNGNQVDLKIATLTLGECNQVSPVAGAGILQFNQGTVDATAIRMAINSSSGTANGTVTVGGGTLIIGSGGISLVNQTAGAGAGTLNITAGTVICSNSITKTGNAGTGNISLTDGSLKMLGGTIGSLAVPIDTLTLSDSGAADTFIQLNAAIGVTNIAATTVAIASGVTTLNIASIAGPTSGATVDIPLISYTGGSPATGLALGSLPPGYTGGSLFDSGATIDLVVTAPAPLVWNGAVGAALNSSWDTTTLDWLNGATPSAYADYQFAQFDDTGKTNVATLLTTVSPAGLDVSNNVVNYTFNGAGKISGPVVLIKQGNAKLTLDNSGINDFSGGINIAGGTVQVGNNDANGNLSSGIITDNGTLTFGRTDSNTVANFITGTGGVTQSGSGISKLAGTNNYGGATLISGGTIIVANAGAGGNSSLGAIPGGAVTITNGGTLDVGGIATAQGLGFTNAAGQAKQFYIAGAGVGGNGAIVNNGTVNQQDALQLLTLTGNATVGGPARWDLRGTPAIAPILDLGGFTLTKSGSNQMSMVSVIVTNGGSIVINSGILSFETTSSNATTAITVNANGVLGHFREQATLFTAPITLNGGMIRDLNGAPGSTNDSPITLTANSFLDLNAGSTDLLQLNGVIAESGGSFGLTKTNIGSYALSATNTYSGTTLVTQGRLILTGNGSIANSKTVTVAAGATLDASARVDTTLAVNANQTLSGAGTVTGTVTTVSSSVIAPGTPTSVGTLTIVGNTTLSGTNVFKVGHNGIATNDALAVNGALVLGGKLNISALATAPAANDIYTLFSATGGVTGTFAATNLPALGGGLGWDTTNLVSGILHVIATVNPTPAPITTVVNGNQLTLSWPADHTGWRLQVQTNGLNRGLNTNWSDVAGSTTVNSVSVTMNPVNGTVFYRMVYP
ncbi:MAG TPA: autotransporter-associated beta strand repeat-containing protein [Verrucomicrobiae bacterium]|nr:autotransporter-associated beta strand repeat-containing protein [Verrucomicrobiae bacterium]